MKKVRLSSPLAVLLLSLYFLCVFNVGYWREVINSVPQENTGVIFVAIMFIAFLAAMFVIVNLLFLPYLHKLLIPFLLIAGSAAAYATMTLGTYFNGEMLKNVLQTNPGETKALLSWQYVSWIMLTGLIPAIFYACFFQPRYCSRWYREVLLRLGGMLFGLVLFGGLAYGFYGDFAPFFRNHKPIVHKLNPTNLLGAGFKTAYAKFKGKTPFTFIGMDARQLAVTHPDGKPKVLILVVGETTRAQNWGLNGYARQTTPELSALDGVINFSHATSCGTSTAVSVPCMFSGMTRSEYDEGKATYQSNLMDILKQAGVGTFWSENDGGCKGVCDRIEHQDIKNLLGSQFCSMDGCLDMGLLQDLPQRLQNIKHDTVIVLHTMGNHGPAYFQRYPDEFRRFTPTCDTNEIQACSQEKLVNTYDNATIYVDHMLAATIALLKQQRHLDSALWYFSDHGESLGENGLYLHAAPYMIAPAEQTHIPMIFWSSAGFDRSTNLHPGCLKAKAQNESVSHDNLFPSVLGILNIHTTVYRPELDIFKSCRQ